MHNQNLPLIVEASSLAVPCDAVKCSATKRSWVQVLPGTNVDCQGHIITFRTQIQTPPYRSYSCDMIIDLLFFYFSEESLYNDENHQILKVEKVSYQEYNEERVTLKDAATFATLSDCKAT